MPSLIFSIELSIRMFYSLLSLFLYWQLFLNRIPSHYLTTHLSLFIFLEFHLALTIFFFSIIFLPFFSCLIQRFHIPLFWKTHRHLHLLPPLLITLPVILVVLIPQFPLSFFTLNLHLIFNLIHHSIHPLKFHHHLPFLLQTDLHLPLQNHHHFISIDNHLQFLLLIRLRFLHSLFHLL